MAEIKTVKSRKKPFTKKKMEERGNLNGITELPRKSDQETETDLKPEWKKFADEYMWGEVRWNATACYLIAYPNASYETCRTQGAELLAKPRIQAYIKQERERLETKLDITKEVLVREQLDILTKCKAPIPILKKDKPTGFYKFDSSGANKAIETLAKLLGLNEAEKVDLGANLNSILSELTKTNDIN